MDEYIKREAVIEAIMSEPPDAHYPQWYVDKIKSIPAADVVEVRHGRWYGEGDGYADGEIVIDVWYCSECDYCIDDGTDDPNILPNYCPNCGAKMDKEVADDKKQPEEAPGE